MARWGFQQAVEQMEARDAKLRELLFPFSIAVRSKAGEPEVKVIVILKEKYDEALSLLAGEGK